jgi:predicted amidohydrolase YtcJ
MMKLLFLFLCSFPLLAVSMILHNGRVVTQDAQNSIHQAIAIRDGRIVATGANAAILAMREAGTRGDRSGRTDGAARFD